MSSRRNKPSALCYVAANVPPAVLRELDRRAAAGGRTRASVVRELLATALGVDLAAASAAGREVER